MARRFIIEGKVQGVWFRDSTRREAKRLGLTGYAINLPDGNVEVLAAGPEDALDRLAAWLEIGPPMASVLSVQSQSVDIEAPEGFRTG